MFLPGSLPAAYPLAVRSISAVHGPLSLNQPNSPGLLRPAQVGALGASRTKIRTSVPNVGGVPPVACCHAHSDSVIASDVELCMAGPHCARAQGRAVLPW